ncbi:MAG: disulfide bond formation protein B [Actinomycetota bacterium]
MGVETVTLFLAMLAVVALVGSAALVVSFLTGDRFGLWAAVRPLSTEFAAAVAVTATAGSLYLSEGAQYTPCRLCWIQRGFMYPAAVLLVAAVVTRRAWLRLTAAGLAAVGLLVAAFHRYEQEFGGVGDFCQADNPCSLRWVNEFGFMTIPTMAGIGFVAILTLVVLRELDERRSRQPAPMPAVAESERVPVSDRS